MTEILILDQQPQEFNLKIKKPYLNATFSTLLESFIFYDRYRFQFGLDDKMKLLPNELVRLRKSDEIVYLNLHMDQLLLITQNLEAYLFDISSNQIQKLNLSMNMMRRISIPKTKSGFSNKWKQGKPKFEIMNNYIKFEIYYTKIGWFFMDENKAIYFYSDFDNHEIKLFDSYDAIDLVESNNMIAISVVSRIDNKYVIQSQSLYLSEDRTLLRKCKKAYFYTIDKLPQLQQQQFISPIIMKTNKQSLKSCICLNFSEKQFNIYLVDLYQSQTVINLTQKLSFELMESTRSSLLESVIWCQNVLIISTSNGNILTFDQNGNQIKLISQKLHNQSIVPNRQFFMNDFLIYLNQTNKEYRCFNNAFFSHNFNQLNIFQGFKMITLQTKVIKRNNNDVDNINSINKQQLIYFDYPFVNYKQQILIQDDLFLNPYATFKNFIIRVKQRDNNQQTIYQGLNSILYFIHVNEEFLAWNTLVLLKTFCSSKKLNVSKINQEDTFKRFQQDPQIIQLYHQGQFRTQQFQDNNKPDNLIISQQHLFEQIHFVILLKVLKRIQNSKEVQFKTVDDFKVTSYSFAFYMLKQLKQKVFQSQQEFIKKGKEFIVDVIRNVKPILENEQLIKNRYQAIRVKKIVRKNQVSKMLFLLLQTDEQNKFSKLLDLFKQNQAQQLINTDQQFLFTQIFERIQSQVTKLSSMVEVKLPIYLFLIDNLKDTKLLDELEPLNLRKYQLQINKSVHNVIKDDLLKFGFYAHLNKLEDIYQRFGDLKQIDIQQLLYLGKLVSEIKSANFQSCPIDYFLELIKKQAVNNYNHRYMVSSFQILFQWGLIDIASSQSSIHQQRLLEKQQLYTESQKQLPDRFVIFMLQNLNRLTLQQLKRKELPNLTFRNSKLSNFLLDTFALITGKSEMSFDLNLNTLYNAPNVELGLIQLIRFAPVEEKLHSQMQTYQISPREKVNLDNNLGNNKIHIWKTIVMCWLIQCEFIAKNSKRQEYEIRRINLLRILKIKSIVKVLNNLSEYEQGILQLYQAKQNDDILEYIGRILLDNEFTKFLNRFSKLVQIYSRNLIQCNIQQINIITLENEESRQTIENMVKMVYHQQYKKIKDIYGLKLNYSYKINKQLSEVTICKRIEKKWFKELNIINKIKKDTNIQIIDEELKENELSQIHDLDSTDQDQLSKSFILDVTQILDKSQDIIMVGTSDNEELNKTHLKIPVTNSRLPGTPERTNEFDDFSRASSKEQDEMKSEINKLFIRKESLESDKQSAIENLVERKYSPENLAKIENAFTRIQQLIWKKQTQAKYQVLYKLQLLDSLSKSQERLKRQYHSRYQSIDQDMTTQQSVNDHTTTQSDRFNGHQRYQTPTTQDGLLMDQQKFRRLSPEDDSQHQFSRLEYSPIIVDDATDQEDSLMIEKTGDGLDTSRFAAGGFQPESSFRSNISNVTRLIDPQQHFQTLKSPISKKNMIRLQNDKKKSELQQYTDEYLPKNVKEMSPVHFNEPNKYDHLNNSRITSKIYLLDHRKRSMRIMTEDHKPPSPINAMLLKPQGFSNKIGNQNTRGIRLIRFKQQK